MAVLPGTQFATAQPSGRTGQTTWGAPPQGEGQDIAQGIGKLGTAVLNYALKVQDQEMTAEFYEKQRLIDEAGWAAREAVTGDEEADNALWEKFQADTVAIAGSSKYQDVNERLMQHVNQVSPNWEHGIRTASLGIRAKNAEDQQKYNLLMALENGDQQTFDKIIEEGKRTKTITPVQEEHYRKYGAGYGALARAERFIANNQYNLALAELDATEKMEMTTEQLKDKKVLRLTAEKSKDDNDRVLVNDVMGKVAGGTPLNEVLNLIQQTVNLDNIQKTELAKVAVNTANVWQTQGENPYTTTQDYQKLTQAYIDIRSNKIKNFTDLRSKWLEGNKLNWSLNHNVWLENMLPQAGKGAKISPDIAKTLQDSLDALYQDDKGKFIKEKRSEWIAKRQTLDNYLATADPQDPEAITKFYDDLTQSTKETNTKSLLSSLWSVGSPLGLIGKTTGAGKLAGSPAYLLFSAGIAYLNRKQANMTEATPSAKSPFPDYPDAYLEDGLWTVIKDGQKYRIQP